MPREIYTLELGKFMHKAYYKALPYCLNNMFTRIENVHQYPTSSSRSRVYYRKINKSEKSKNWISSAGIELWESLNYSLRNLNFFQFKCAFKKQLINDY